MPSDRVAALLLADEPTPEHLRALLPIDGRPMIDVVVEQALSWPVDEVVVVLGAAGEEILQAAKLTGATVLLEPDWKSGSVSLLRVGLDWLSRGRTVERAVLAPCDLPQLSAAVVDELVYHPRFSNRPILAPKYRYAWDWPLIIDEPVWPRLMGLDDDMEIRQLLQAHPELVDEVWIDQVPPTRITSRDDLTALRRRG